MTKTDRRWFRFSLRTLFVAVTMLAVSLPALIDRYQRWLAYRQLDEAITNLTKGPAPGKVRFYTEVQIALMRAAGNPAGPEIP